MTDLRNRVERLERRPGVGGMVVVTIAGGFSDNPETASVPGTGRTWRRREGEDKTEFVARVRAEAIASGEKTLVIGGFVD